MAKRENGIKYVDYVCRQCKNEDRDKLFDGEQQAPAINCWSCGAGRGLDINKMFESGKGMFPKRAAQIG